MRIGICKNRVDEEKQNSFKNGKASHLTQEDIMRYDRVSEIVDKALNAWGKVMATKEDKLTIRDKGMSSEKDYLKDRADAYALTLEAFLSVINWIVASDDETKGYMWEAITTGITGNDVNAVIKQIIGDGNFADILFQQFLEIRIKIMLKKRQRRRLVNIKMEIMEMMEVLKLQLKQ